MSEEPGLAAAAQLFKVLGNESRLRLLRLLEEQRTVGELVETTGLTQPLVSQHLRILRASNLVTSTRRGRQVMYGLADAHVAHVVADALTHAGEYDKQEGIAG